jgi:acetyl-CoA carboxylase carboxyltransferase component
MGSRALGADLALALESAVISTLSPETAVAFAMNDQITADKSRAEVEAEWRETYASPLAAAESGDIDDVIPEEELRARIISALYMLAEKADGTPDRKHGVPTL